jgi:DNA-binding response OmpR family regulator
VDRNAWSGSAGPSARVERNTHLHGEIASRTVDTHVKRLRDKLGTAGRFFMTVRGVGYRFNETGAEESD